MERETEEGGILEKKGKLQVEERMRRRVSKVKVEMAGTSRDARAKVVSSSGDEWAQM